MKNTEKIYNLNIPIFLGEKKIGRLIHNIPKTKYRSATGIIKSIHDHYPNLEL